MSELVQVRKKAQITLPQSVRKKLGIEEGDFLDFEDRDGEIVLKAKKLIDKDQAWSLSMSFLALSTISPSRSSKSRKSPSSIPSFFLTDWGRVIWAFLRT